MSTALIDTESRKVPVTQDEIMRSFVNRVINVEKEDNFRDLVMLTHEVINHFYGMEEEKDE